MIIVKPVGGLTSQMHKYAMGKALSLKHDVPLKLDLSWFEDTQKTDTPWPYQLDYFHINAQIATFDEIKSLKGSNFFNTWARRIKRYIGINLYKKTYINQSFLSKENFLKLGPNTYLEGEWAGFEYFSEYKKEILDELSLKIPLSLKTQEHLAKIKNENSVSMHIRRGDYVFNPEAAKFHAICSSDYYQEAIDYITERLPDIKLYIFSDDIAWTKEHLHFDLDTIYVENTQNYEDLELMAACKHNIMANSGFSLWGAWMNQNPSKIVISPTVWVFDTNINQKILDSYQNQNFILIGPT
ncbi:MAG: alpha-1,2-fucosyltransferase [Sulfuricurvum sp.]|nr:alpha-1,2-fucosyltransferase [Sulfuricurvum sp.]